MDEIYLELVAGIRILCPKETHGFHVEDPFIVRGTKELPCPWMLRRVHGWMLRRSSRKRELGIISASKREM